MPDLLYLLAILACPVGMGVMMLLMMRGHHSPEATSDSTDEVAQLRAEVEQLRAEHPTDQRPTHAPTES